MVRSAPAALLALSLSLPAAAASWQDQPVPSRANGLATEVKAIDSYSKLMKGKYPDAQSIVAGVQGYYEMVAPGKCDGAGKATEDAFAAIKASLAKTAKDVSTSKAAAAAAKSGDWAAFKKKLGALPGVTALAEACLKLEAIPAACNPAKALTRGLAMVGKGSGKKKVNNGAAAKQVYDACIGGGSDVKVSYGHIKEILATTAPEAGKGSTAAKAGASAPKKGKQK